MQFSKIVRNMGFYSVFFIFGVFVCREVSFLLSSCLSLRLQSLGYTKLLSKVKYNSGNYKQSCKTLFVFSWWTQWDSYKTWSSSSGSYRTCSHFRENRQACELQMGRKTPRWKTICWTLKSWIPNILLSCFVLVVCMNVC